MSFCGPEGFGPFAPKDLRIDFTPCFEEMVFLFPVKILMILIGAWRIYKFSHKSAPSINSFSLLFWSKNVVSFSLFVTSIIELVWVISEENPFGYTLLSSISAFLAMMIASFLHFFEHYRARRTSPILLIYWLVMLIGYSFKLRTDYEIAGGLDKYSTLDCVNISFLIIIFVLSNFPIQGGIYQSLDDDHSEKACPERTANFFSVLSFWWMNTVMITGYKKPLSMNDLWNLNPEDESKFVSKLFEKAWSEENPSNPSILRALTKSVGGPFIVAAFFKLGQDALAFVQPALLDKLIDFIESYCDGCETQQPRYKGYLIAIGMFVAAVVQTILLHQYFHRCFYTGMRIRAAIVTAVYQKAFRLSNDSRQKSTVGEIVNHMAVDAQRLMDLCSYVHILWSGPFQIILSIYFLYQTLGASIFAGVLVMVSLIPINAVVANRTKNLQKIQMGNKDTRIKLMDELLGGIKVVKLYAWERSFLNKVFGVREKELSTLKQIAYYGSFQTFSWTCAPFLVSLVSFAFYVLLGDQPLTSDKAFVSLSLFNLLQFPLTMLPSVITASIEASVAVNRLVKFLSAEETDPNNRIVYTKEEIDNDLDEENLSNEKKKERNLLREYPIVIENSEFQWNRSAAPVLKDIQMKVKDGSLVAVVGSVGCGKSSLISALLGDMVKNRGKVMLKGSVAYVAQQAWIVNSTLKENITFGSQLDEKLYRATIECCALGPDIDILPAGDSTEIGEKGINLSGGQKQRVSLARSVYNQADIYLLDDPLSAVDSHVGKHIFENVIGPKGMLKNKIRILVTHAVQYLSKCDLIIVMKDGCIIETGSFDELFDSGGELKRIVTEYGATEEDTKEDVEKKSEADFSSSNITISKSVNANPEDQKQSSKKAVLIEQESSEKGDVKLSVYRTYFESMGIMQIFWLFVFFVLGQVAQIGMNVWLSYWSSQETNEDLGLYLGVYAFFGVVLSIFVVLQSIFCFVVCGMTAARVMHSLMLNNVIRSPMSFFDTTPLGRILNRFSKDQNTIDETLPRTFQAYLRTLFQVIGILVVISYSTIGFLIVIVPMAVLYYYVQRYYLATSRELKRLDSVSRSPIYSHFSETLSGATTIRAYHKQKSFIDENENRLDFNHKAYYPSIASNRWLATRLEFVGALIVLFAAVLAVFAFDTIDSSKVGLSLTYALSVTQTLNWMVRMSCDLEANVVSVERAKEYSQLKNEAPPIIEDSRPPKQWPGQGVVEFQNYSTRYREGLDLVLKKIHLKINTGEKIGVVGRTGAGKSSLTLSLFRIIEASEGAIIIDGVNISTIGLEDLRSCLTIIPQDPVLFSGTLRENLDPFNQYSDEQVWRALECAHLLSYIKSLEKGLNHVVAQGGENFSVGQRQLICLGRALLRKTKILILDEATASIDFETDSIIQKTIREEFKDCTIITIAHRINTILDNDRILVLDKGMVAEYDTPQALLQNTSTIFYSMTKKAGLA